MNWELFAAFLVLTLVLVITPGPIVTLVIATAATRGIRAGLVTIVGTISATLGMLLNVLLLIIGVGGSLFLAFKAYSNEEFELPQLGALARQWS